MLKVHGLYNKQKKERHGAAHAEDHVLDNMKKKFGQIGEMTTSVRPRLQTPVQFLVTSFENNYFSSK